VSIYSQDRELSFNRNKRDHQGEINAYTGLTVLAYLGGVGLVSWATEQLMPTTNNPSGTIYNWTRNTMFTPHDINAITQISSTSLALAAICAPEQAKQFRQFAWRAPIAAIIFAVSRSAMAQSLYGHIPFFKEALKLPTKEVTDVYPMAGKLTSGVVAIATYKALDPAITYAGDTLYQWWHGIYNEHTESSIDSKTYDKVLK
jgi:hypothetical protein